MTEEKGRSSTGKIIQEGITLAVSPDLNAEASSTGSERVSFMASAELKLVWSITELEEQLAPMFEEMREDRLYRIAYGDDINFSGRPKHASVEAVQLLARYHYEKRRREEQERRSDEREAQARRTNWAIALVSALTGVLLTLALGGF